MLSQKEILDAVDRELLTLFPGLTLYRNDTPSNFKRPSAMTRLTNQTMATRTTRSVDRQATVTAVLFCPVDDFHNTDVDALFAMSDLVMEHFSSPALPVADRFLDIGSIQCNVQADFAEIKIPLTWDDDRQCKTTQKDLMQILHLDKIGVDNFGN